MTVRKRQHSNYRKNPPGMMPAPKEFADPEFIQLTKPGSVEEAEKFRTLTQEWIEVDCKLKQLPTCSLTSFESSIARLDAVQTVGFIDRAGLVEAKFGCDPMDVRPCGNFAPCFHRADNYCDDDEPVYIARITPGPPPPIDQTELFWSSLQSLLPWLDAVEPIDTIVNCKPVGFERLANDLATHWKSNGATCFNRGVSAGALLVAASSFPKILLTTETFGRGNFFTTQQKKPYVWVHPEWLDKPSVWAAEVLPPSHVPFLGDTKTYKPVGPQFEQ